MLKPVDLKPCIIKSFIHKYTKIFYLIENINVEIEVKI